MPQTLRKIGLGILVFSLFWAGDSLVALLFFPHGDAVRQIFHPPAQIVYIRTIGGFILALGTVCFRTKRKMIRQTRAELTAEKELYEALVGSFPDGILVLRDLNIIFANRNAREFLGPTENDAPPDVSCLDFILPEYHDLVRETAARIMAGQKTDPLEIRARKEAGQVRDLSVTGVRISWAGNPALLSFFRDITTEVRNRHNLIASGERLQLALDAARDGVWDWDIASGTIVYSESWANMLGYSLEEITPSLDTWRDLLHPDDLQRAQILVEKHLQGLIPRYEIEVRLRHKQGHYIWVLDRGKVVERDTQGNPLRMTGTHRDITARKEAELALEIRNRVAETFLTAEIDHVFERLLDVVCDATGTGIGLFVTQDPHSGLKIQATLPRTSHSHPVSAPVLSFDKDHLPEVFSQVVFENRSLLRNEPLAVPDQAPLLESVLGVPICSRDNVLGALFLANKSGGFRETDQHFLESLAGYIAPILQSHLNTEAKETQLRQAQKMEALGALAGGIAHDFNNILQAIMGFTTLALEDAGTGGTIPGDLERVLKATRRGQELVQRILLFSRRNDQRHVAVDIQSVVTEAINLLKPTIPATIEIRSELRAEGAHVFGDPGQISQIILNLATNSYHAMEPDGGVLEIKLNTLSGTEAAPGCPDKLRNRDLVVLVFADTGVGMSAETRDRIFDPFFTTKEVGQGTGLGMSVVHGIVQAHQGEIQIESEPGAGTTVTVFLPLFDQSPSTEQREPEAAETTGPPRNIHVAVVDDEQDIADIAKTLLERIGLQVTKENDGLRILETLEKDPYHYDLVITDLTMPRITGLQLAARLARIRPDLPVVLITGMSEHRGINLESHPNIKELIHKPFEGGILRATIERVLSDSGLGKQGRN